MSEHNLVSISVAHRGVKATTQKPLVAGNVRVDEAVATFDAEWADMDAITCYMKNGTTAPMQVTPGERFTIPSEVLNAGHLTFAFVGIKGRKVLRTKAMGGGLSVAAN